MLAPDHQQLRTVPSPNLKLPTQFRNFSSCSTPRLSESDVGHSRGLNQAIGVVAMTRLLPNALVDEAGLSDLTANECFDSDALCQ